jgi:MFS family permease
MAVASALILLLPDHHQIGSLAGVLLIALRLVQGISLSGETIISWIYISEASDTQKSPWYLSILAATELVGGIVALSLGYLTVKYNLWWKTPFIFTTVFIFFSLYLRKSLRESPEYTKHLNKTMEMSSKNDLIDFYKQKLFRNKNFYASISFFYLYPIAFIISYVYLGNLLVNKGFLTQEGLFLHNIMVSFIEIVIGLSVGSLFLKFEFLLAKYVTLVKYTLLFICCFFLPLLWPSFFLETYAGIFLMQCFLVTLSMASLIIASCFKVLPTLGRCSTAGTAWALGKILSFFILLFFNEMEMIGSLDVIFLCFSVLIVITTICVYLYIPYERLDKEYLQAVSKRYSKEQIENITSTSYPY